MLVSEPFYASIYGSGQGSAAPAIVQSGGYEEEASTSTGNFDFENGLISGITDVLDGALVKGHIDVDPVLRKNGYKTYVAKENGMSPDPDQMGSYEEVYSKTTFIGYNDYRAEGYPEGHYQVKTTGNNEETEIDCYIFDNIQDFFFGYVFAQSKQAYDQKSHKYFVNGNRVLMSPGIDIGFDIPYSDLLYPTYVGEVSLRATKYLSKASSLSISVTHTGFDGAVTTSHYSSNVFASDYDVSTPGLYEIEIATVFNAQSGYNPSFRIRFYILGDDAKPLINYYRALYGVNSKADYISTVYTVDLGIKLCRPYLNYTAEIHGFTDIYLNRDFDNSLIYKEDIPVTLLFADYSSALSYALSFGKQYVEKIGDDQFVISGDMSTIYDEVTIYRELLDYAKSKVQKTYTYLLPEDELLGFHVEGNRYIVANGDNYYMDTEPMPSHVYLTPSVQEREKLLSRDFINDFVFANDRNHLYAKAVDIYREGNDGEWIFVKTYNAYDGKTVEDILGGSVPSGTYKFVERSHGGEKSFTKTYIATGKCTATLTFATSLGSKKKTKTVTCESDGITIKKSEYPYLDAYSRGLDDQTLFFITSPSGETVIKTNPLGYFFLESGTYTIEALDRLGNSFKIYYEVD